MKNTLLRSRINSIKYTLAHRKAFLKVEKSLIGKNTLRGYIHDLDKVFLKMLFDKKTVQKIHRNYSRHHNKKAHTKSDYIQMVIDWECARYTKPDKPLKPGCGPTSVYLLYVSKVSRVIILYV